MRRGEARLLALKGGGTGVFSHTGVGGRGGSWEGRGGTTTKKSPWLFLFRDPSWREATPMKGQASGKRGEEKSPRGKVLYKIGGGGVIGREGMSLLRGGNEE